MRDNLSDRDNQQERSEMNPEIGYYLAGFADGEGHFNISFRRRQDYKIPWKVSLCFNISQKDKIILALFKHHLGCGTLRGRPDGVWYYEVNNFTAIIEKVIPFFKQYHFLSAKKKRDFSKFCQLAEMMKQGRHLNSDGIKEILEIRREMNDGGKRKFTDQIILHEFQKSSETTCQISINVENDIVRSFEKSEVIGVKNDEPG